MGIIAYSRKEIMFSDIFKSGKSVYSKWFAQYRLSDEQLRDLQNCLLKILTDLKTFCDAHDICLMACAGTLLGAIRHKGFIPWDDDIDVMMLREDYDRFEKLFLEAQQNGEFKEYELAIPLVSKEYYFKIPKLYLKGTEYRSVNYMGNPRYNEVGLDFFIIEKVPQNGIRRFFRGLIHDFAFYASSFCLDARYPSPVILEKCRESREVRRFYSFRRRLGSLFSHLGGMKFYLKICAKTEEYRGKSSLCAFPTGISYNREVFPESVFTETVKCDFCGLKLDIPKDYDGYLRNLYGDYMIIPEEDEREIHVAYSLKV